MYSPRLQLRRGQVMAGRQRRESHNAAKRSSVEYGVAALSIRPVCYIEYRCNIFVSLPVSK